MTKPTAEALKQAPTRDRSQVKRGFSGQVDPEGGDRGAGIIEGYSVITRGPALGHGLWCDDVFIGQVYEALDAAGDAGVKSRFTHPGLSSDGLGRFLGNTKNPSRHGDQVKGDLHFSTSSHKTPDGDLAEHLMDMAQNDPDKFGSSIVFDHDFEAMDEFMAAHTDGKGNFKSPDPDNVNNLPHCRLKKLRAVDMVDDPAANPGGLFHRNQEVAQEATALMEYALDLDGATPPAVGQFDIDPDRLKSFFTRFLENNGLEITPRKEKETEAMTKETSTPGDNSTQETPAAPTRADFAADLKRYTDAFGGENGAKWFSEGLDFEAAQGNQIELLNKQLTARDETIKDLEEKLAAIDTGETDAFEASGTGKEEKKTFASCFRVRQTQPAKN